MLKNDIPADVLHLCVDMQRLFSAEGPWPTPWMHKVLPTVVQLVSFAPERTVFTRFITPERTDDMPGVWQRYYRKWPTTTREQMDIRLLNLMPELEAFTPPAVVIDKTRYSAFAEPGLLTHLQQRGTTGLIITGSETDICVMATVIAAVDIGFRVIVVENAICSSSDEGHDALLALYSQRFSEQIETASAEEILARWRR